MDLARIGRSVRGMDELLADWFVREILCHEAALTRYLARSWSNPHDVPDLRQEVYIRVLEAAEQSPPAAPKYFLFTVARHLLIDRARRYRIVPIDLFQDHESLDALVDEVSPERSAGGLQQLQRLLCAFEKLPERCREVVWLRKIEDLPQKEIAVRLGVGEGTVEAHLVRGMRLLTRFFHGVDAAAVPADRGSSASEVRHGG